MQTVGLAVSGTQNKITVDSLFNNKQSKIVRYGNNSSEVKYAFTYNINKKINASNTFNAGFITDLYTYNYGDSLLYNGVNYLTITDFSGNSSLMQAYVKWQHKFSDKLVLNSGIHHQHFLLNNSIAVEPRLGLKWSYTPKQSLSIGGGMHSQLQPMSVYAYETKNTDGTYTRTNKQLDFSKSNHFVIAYDNAIATNWRVKVESYYQQLYNIPVETRSSFFSVLNVGADYTIPNVDSLVNKGTGKNYGAEFTLEKFFSNNYYCLLTASLYDSKYKGSDGVERNTAFNGNYTINALLGGELNLDTDKRKVITANAKVNYAGGRRYIPIDINRSNMENKSVYIFEQAYNNRFIDYTRIDIKVGFKLNGRKVTQEWALDIQNILNRKNIFQQIYHPVKQQLVTEYQLGFFSYGNV